MVVLPAAMKPVSTMRRGEGFVPDVGESASEFSASGLGVSCLDTSGTSCAGSVRRSILFNSGLAPFDLLLDMAPHVVRGIHNGLLHRDLDSFHHVFEVA